MALSALRSWYDLVRFHEYGPFFILCGAAGALFAAGVPNFKLLTLIAFITAFSASAFIVNDVVDVDEDRLKQRPRNPIAAGRLSRVSALTAFALLAALSLVSLALLGLSLVPAGLMALGLYWGYSWGPRFKSLLFADVVVHGAVPALFVLMGYLLYKPLSFPILLIAGMSFALATMTGVVQEVRDLDADRNFRRTSVAVLGHPRAVDLAIALMAGAVAMYSLLILQGFLNPLFSLFVPFAYFLFEPLVKLRNQSLSASEAISKLRTRGLALSVFLLAAYVLL